jgi:hypothetical protein
VAGGVASEHEPDGTSLDDLSIEALMAVAENDPAAGERLRSRLRLEIGRYCRTPLDDGTTTRSGEGVNDVCLAAMESLMTYAGECELFWFFVSGIASA